MQQLSGLDALFLHLEQANTYMNIGPVMVYAPPRRGRGAGLGDNFQAVYKSFEQGLRHSSIFRRKLVTVPLDLDRPYWVEDSEFCLEEHLSQTYLPQPGDWQQLCAEVSKLHATPLDRSRPLWAAHLIEGLDALEGLPRGCFAIYLKSHHATQDGATGVEMVQAIHDRGNRGKGSRKRPDEDHWKSEREPARTQLLGRAMFNNLQRPVAMAKTIGRALPAARELLGKEEDDSLPLLLDERTRFNGPVSAQRVVGFARFDIAELQAIRPAVANVTLNDVCAAIVSGGLHAYLQSKDEGQSASLVAGAPVNSRRQDQVAAAATGSDTPRNGRGQAISPRTG
jgi:WS/DGAT/MGAT family acyltransferase